MGDPAAARARALSKAPEAEEEEPEALPDGPALPPRCSPDEAQRFARTCRLEVRLLSAKGIEMCSGEAGFVGVAGWLQLGAGLTRPDAPPEPAAAEAAAPAAAEAAAPAAAEAAAAE